ncbi:MAG: T9SS type A sorting domain-containing protein [Tannerella sp.]|jgi:hypothetical protein|nr:T9SS type A sorting domain-containing protein [Tannerella sp.]
MKKVYFIAFFLFSILTTIIAQEKGTIIYGTDNCIESYTYAEQFLNFNLENNKLQICGKILANCCGTHEHEYEIYEDSIFLNRKDYESLCDCYCLYAIDIILDNCNSEFYKIKLSDYPTNSGLDTIIYKSQINKTETILQNKNIICYPNPAKEYTIIEIPETITAPYDLILYDNSGKMVRNTNNLKNTKLRLNREALPNGFYFFKITGSNSYISGKIVFY